MQGVVLRRRPVADCQARQIALQRCLQCESNGNSPGSAEKEAVLTRMRGDKSPVPASGLCERGTCPTCSAALVPIVYGMPTHVLFEKAERGEVSLGGCVVSDRDPMFHCTGERGRLVKADPDDPGLQGLNGGSADGR
jgi:hypothetical protein